MNNNNEATQANQPSCSYSPPVQKRPQGIMKSTPRLDENVDKIWNQPNQESTALDNSSADDFPTQPPIRQIEVVYLDTTTCEDNTNADVPIADLIEDTPAGHPDVPRVEVTEDTSPLTPSYQRTSHPRKPKKSL